MTTAAHTTPMRGPLTLLLDLFSSVRLGIVLLTLLFIYSCIGSSGVPTHPLIWRPDAWEVVRSWRVLDMTEFEWFHWWPFDLLIVLICINIAVTTVRRIKLNVINLGVWMIHTGILILSAGSIWYFSTKVEGDAPVLRRALVVEAPGSERVVVPVTHGARAVVGSGADTYGIEVGSIDPQWELLTEGSKGERAYSVNVRVLSARSLDVPGAVGGPNQPGEFIRQVIAGHEDLTEDLVRTNNPEQPMQRVKKLKTDGSALADDRLNITLAYAPQPWFYLMKSRALYLREVKSDGTRGPWVQRRIDSLPRYNDCIATADDVWPASADRPPALHPLHGAAAHALEAADPLGSDVTIGISRYLRYATLETRRRPAPADSPLDPAIDVELRSQGTVERYHLAAFSDTERTAGDGTMLMSWIANEQAIDAHAHFTWPKLRVAAQGPNGAESVDVEIRSPGDGVYTPVGATGVEFTIERYDRDLRIQNKVSTVALVRIRKDGREFLRAVADDAALTADFDDSSSENHGMARSLDPTVETTLMKGVDPPAAIHIVGGPAETDLRIITLLPGQDQRIERLAVGTPVEMTAGVELTVTRFAARTVLEERPRVIPEEQRDRSLDDMLSMIQVDVPVPGKPGEVRSAWLTHHLYPFENPNEVLRRFPYRPVEISLPDGKGGTRTIELLYSRARMALPAPVVLDSFVVTSHVGGFTGATSSVRNWTSMIRFQDEAGAWGPSQPVSVNEPIEHGGYSYYQAQWDPPDSPRFQGDPGSAGLNYTVLGVGNRNGVNVQLFGCVISVIGMLYAFYIKPMIKRRRQQAVYAQVQAGRAQEGASRDAATGDER